MKFEEFLKKKDNFEGLSYENDMQIKQAYKSLMQEVERSEDVRIVSDFDVDGIASASIYARMFPNARVRIGDRFEGGYGIPSNLNISQGTLVICSDIGSTDLEKLCEIGNFTGKAPFVIDHHEYDEYMKDYPRMLNFSNKELNSKRMLNFSGEEKCPDYCATGLAYKIFEEYAKEHKVDERTMNTVKAFACIGTVADCVKVNNPYDDNRKIIMEGLDIIKNATPDTMEVPLLYFLDEVCECVGVKNLTTKDVGFKIAPLINATSRLVEGGARQVYALLNMDENALLQNLSLLEQLDSLKETNELRKKIVNNATLSIPYKECVKEYEKNPTGVIIYRNDTIPQGVTRMISNRLSDTLHCPAIAITKNKEGNLVGSGSNAEGYPNLFEKCDVEGMLSFGGHPDAVGMSMTVENFDLVCQRIKENYKDVKPLDIKKDYLELFDNFGIDDLMKLEPFGTDFPQPEVEMTNARITNFRLLQGAGQAQFTCNGVKCITFSQADKFLKKEENKKEEKSMYDFDNSKDFTVRGSLGINHYKGTETLQISVTQVDAVEREKVLENKEVNP